MQKDGSIHAVIPFLELLYNSITASHRPARPSEMLNIRPCDIDRSSKIWVYSPADHKTAHHGYDRKIYLGPRSQQILIPFLFRPAETYCFSPAEAYAERLAKLHANRKTPLSCGNKPGIFKKDEPKWKPGEVYDVVAYRLAITRAIERAFPAPEHLRQFPDETNNSGANVLPKRKKWSLRRGISSITGTPTS